MSKELPEWPFNMFMAAVTVIALLIGGLWIYESHLYEVCKRVNEKEWKQVELEGRL